MVNRNATQRARRDAQPQFSDPRTFWLVPTQSGWTWSGIALASELGGNCFDSIRAAYGAAMDHFDSTGHRGNGHALAQVAITAELAHALSDACVAQLGAVAGEHVVAAAGNARAMGSVRCVRRQPGDEAAWDQAMDIAYEQVMGFSFDGRSQTQSVLRLSAFELVKQRLVAEG